MPAAHEYSLHGIARPGLKDPTAHGSHSRSDCKVSRNALPGGHEPSTHRYESAGDVMPGGHGVHAGDDWPDSSGYTVSGGHE